MATGNQEEGHSGPAQQVSDDDLLARLQSATRDESSPPVLSTSDMADLLPIGREATRRRLNELKDDNRVRTYKAGRNPVWWPAEGEEGGEIDPDGMHPDDIGHLNSEQIERLIDPGDVSKDFARRVAGEKLENYSEQTKWDSFTSVGATAISFGFTMVVGLFVLNTANIAVPVDVFDLFVGIGVVVAIAGLPYWAVGIIMRAFANREYIPHNRWPTLEEVGLIPGKVWNDFLTKIGMDSKSKPN